jgi:hypothetical protein
MNVSFSEILILTKDAILNILINCFIILAALVCGILLGYKKCCNYFQSRKYLKEEEAILNCIKRAQQREINFRG